MNITEFLDARGIVTGVKVGSRKQLLQKIAVIAAEQLQIDEEEIFRALFEREKLGSTAMGKGIAIPHGKIPDLKNLMGIFVQLDTAIDYDAADGNPVDLFFVLLAPQSASADHLKAIACISRQLREPNLMAQLRQANKASAIYDLLTREDQANAA